MGARGGVRIAGGVIALLAGTACLGAAVVSAGSVAAIDSLVGRSGVVTRDMGTVSGSPADVAVVVDGVEARITADGVPPGLPELLSLAGTSPQQLIDQRGSFVLLATPTADGDAFLGTGSPGAIDDYLFGHPYAVAELAGGTWTTVSVPGEGSPGLPETAGAWGAQARGRPAELPASSLAGQTLVVMSPDARPGVSTDLRLEYRVPDAPSALRSAAVTAAAAGIGGLLLVLLGAWLVVGRRPRGRHA